MQPSCGYGRSQWEHFIFLFLSRAHFFIRYASLPPCLYFTPPLPLPQLQLQPDYFPYTPLFSFDPHVLFILSDYLLSLSLLHSHLNLFPSLSIMLLFFSLHHASFLLSPSYFFSSLPIMLLFFSPHHASFLLSPSYFFSSLPIILLFFSPHHASFLLSPSYFFSSLSIILLFFLKVPGRSISVQHQSERAQRHGCHYTGRADVRYLFYCYLYRTSKVTKCDFQCEKFNTLSTPSLTFLAWPHATLSSFFFSHYHCITITVFLLFFSFLSLTHSLSLSLSLSHFPLPFPLLSPFSLSLFTSPGIFFWTPQ